MPYTCELAPGHHVYLDNQGEQTIITTAMGLPGQQQQASNSMTTGVWTAPPEAYRLDSGTVFKIFTAQGETCICVQGSSVSVTTAAAAAGAKPVSMQQTAAAQPMKPMQPMQPMKMGNMQMSINPMEMRMGDMELKMDAGNQAPSPSAQSPTRQFCSQCGTKVAPEDKFCSRCGHSLS